MKTDENLNVEKNSKSNFENILHDREASELKKNRYELIFKIYGVTGFILGILGGAYFILNTFEFDLNSGQRTGLLFSLTGFLVGVFSYLALSIIKQRRVGKTKHNEYKEYLWEFLDNWVEFEKTGRRALSAQDANFSSNSIRLIIDRLIEYGFIDKDDSLELLDAMRARNAMLHGGGEVPANVIRNHSEFLLGITSKLISRSGLTVR